MLPFIETVSGTAYEMGFQQGQIYKHVIKGDVQQWAMRHSFQGSDAYIKKSKEVGRKLNQEMAPWVEEEIRGIADGSGIDAEWLHLLNLRIWETPNLPFDPKAEAPKLPQIDSSGCTAFGMITEEDGVVIGGNLDDQRHPFALIRRRPKNGLAHLTVARVGGIWNQNGMNEAGLFMAADGMGKHPDFLDPNPSPLSINGTIKRMVLQTCHNVKEAVDFIIKSRTSHNFVLGDASGNLAAVQVMGSLHDVQYAKDYENMVFCTNHAFMPGIVKPLLAQKCEPYVAEKSIVRFDVLTEARKKMPRNFETLRQMLTSHEGHPNSICNNLSAFSMMARPQKDKNLVYVADMPPCRNEYGKFKVIV
jgi:hypothetical protein